MVGRMVRCRTEEKKGGLSMYIITGDYQGRRITRNAYSDFQAWTIINLLRREGVTNLGMREGTREEETA